MDLRKVSDQILLANMKNLASRERVLYTEVLHHLREIQRRRLFADLGQPSLFAYCVNILKYSNGEADRRIKAVAMIRKMPAIAEKIVSGELSLTNVAKAKEFFNQEGKVAPMKPEAKLELIKKLENKSTREAEKILLAESSSPAPEVKGKAQVKTLAKRRYISVKVTRNVWQKTKGKCANCRGEYALQIDHEIPLSRGGTSELENLRLLCRTCNQRAAIAKIGEDMHRFLG